MPLTGISLSRQVLDWSFLLKRKSYSIGYASFPSFIRLYFNIHGKHCFDDFLMSSIIFSNKVKLK